MKRDQYIPHEVNMRQTSEMINLIQEQGMAGYGLYWGLIEYLRSQDNYIGDLRALKYLARQFRTNVNKLMQILTYYHLFELTDYTFRSRKLETLMLPLERKRKRMAEATRDKEPANSEQNSRNSLNINITSDIVKKSKVKESKESSSSQEEKMNRKDDDDVAQFPTTPLWERLVDSLCQEEQWKEIMAMRSGMGKQFIERFETILHHFKLHIQAVGSERSILSLNDAKRYFCFYITPGSNTCNRLMVELQKHNKDDPYRYEYRKDGKRMYCGIVIPDEAPPRPSDQAVWNATTNKWFY